MLDLKTLKTLDEALDMARDTLYEEYGMNPDGPYTQRFVKAQKRVRSEIAKLERNSVKVAAQRTARTR